MNTANDTESTKAGNPSLFEKIFLRIIQPIALSLATSIFIGYLILQLPNNLYVTAFITGTVVFFFAFRFFYNKVRNDVWARPSSDFSYDGTGNTNDPRNPFSYTTPGSPYYSYDTVDRDRFNGNKSVFSDYDTYQNR